ncbi:MAG: hypothetical protein V2J24_22135 [Pseudomonadales bacterium]|jgi:hypothetical protein|nr:hypothetical protein [Pseudomonadales bacterium]
MNITLSVDEKTVARARKVAEAMGKSLNQVIREELERLARRDQVEGALQEFLETGGQGDSRGWRFDRDELHERA